MEWCLFSLSHSELSEVLKISEIFKVELAYSVMKCEEGIHIQ